MGTATCFMDRSWIASPGRSSPTMMPPQQINTPPAYGPPAPKYQVAEYDTRNHHWGTAEGAPASTRPVPLPKYVPQTDMDPRRMLEAHHFGTMEPCVPPSEPFIADHQARRKAIKLQIESEAMRARWAKARAPPVPRVTENRLTTVEPQDICSHQRDEALLRSREISEYLKVEALERAATDRDLSYYGASGWGQERLDGETPEQAPSSVNIDDAVYGMRGLYGKHFGRPWDAECSDPRTATQVRTPAHLLDLYERQRTGRLAMEASMKLNDDVINRRAAEDQKMREAVLKELQ